MALNFPSSPTNGQIFTVGDRSWIYNSTLGVWEGGAEAVTPSSLGISAGADVTIEAINAASTETTPVDGDFLPMVKTSAGNTLRRLSFLNSWVNYFKGKADALYVALTGNQTVAGSKTFSGQMELTGQAATNDTSAMSRALANSEFIKNVGREYTLPSSTIANASGGTSTAAGSLFAVRVTSGTSLSGLGRSNFSTSLVGDYGQGGNFNRGIPFTLAASFRIRAMTSDFTQVVFGVGIPSTTAAYGSNITASRGIGFRIYYSTVNTRMELKMWANDGTTYSESSIIAIPFTSFFIQSLAIAWDGAGTYSLYSSGSTASNDNPRISMTPIGTMTGLGSNLGWGEAGNASGISLYTNNSSTNTPSASTVVDAMQIRIILGQSIS